MNAIKKLLFVGMATFIGSVSASQNQQQPQQSSFIAPRSVEDERQVRQMNRADQAFSQLLNLQLPRRFGLQDITDCAGQLAENQTEELDRLTELNTKRLDKLIELQGQAVDAGIEERNNIDTRITNYGERRRALEDNLSRLRNEAAQRELELNAAKRKVRQACSLAANQFLNSLHQQLASGVFRDVNKAISAEALIESGGYLQGFRNCMQREDTVDNLREVATTFTTATNALKDEEARTHKALAELDRDHRRQVNITLQEFKDKKEFREQQQATIAAVHSQATTNTERLSIGNSLLDGAGCFAKYQNLKLQSDQFDKRRTNLQRRANQ